MYIGPVHYCIYACGALICREFRHFIDGVEVANSFSFNAHKWILANVTSCCLWVKDSSCLTNSLSTNPQYLRNKASESNQVIDYKDWEIALSRKFQSLKLWFVLGSCGLDNLRKFLRNHVKISNEEEDHYYEFGGKIINDDKKRLVNEVNRKLLDSINGSGKVYMTHGMVGAFVIICANGATLTEEQHVIMAWNKVKEPATSILLKLSKA